MEAEANEESLSNGNDHVNVDEADAAEDDEGRPVTADDESDAPSRPSTPARRGGSRRRRGGRLSKSKTRDMDATDDADGKDEASDKGTPRRRGGWRGGPRSSFGGRWRSRAGGTPHVSQVPLDNEGNMANVKDDELDLPEDAEGETKVDKYGHLQDGREYRVRVFTISGKGDRLYMLSTEPARCIGFRDSYLFFQKHRTLFKVILAEDSKRDLIDRDVIPHSYKGRSIGVVTARSVFREFGAKIVIGGKKIVDDYRVAEARANGDVEGELAVPEDRIPSGTGDAYDRNQYVAWHGASNVYHSGQPSVPLQGGKAVDTRKRKVMVTGANWMLEHAREAGLVYDLVWSRSHIAWNADLDSRFNSSLSQARRNNFSGVYDVHTNMVHCPKILQPSHAKWTEITRTESTLENHGAFQRMIAGHTDSDSVDRPLNFPSVAPILARNFMVTDIYYQAPSKPSVGYPGPDEEVWDIDPPGLTHVPDDVLAELPQECIRSFRDAVQEETEWKRTWQGEVPDANRAPLHITYNSVS